MADDGARAWARFGAAMAGLDVATFCAGVCEAGLVGEAAGCSGRCGRNVAFECFCGEAPKTEAVAGDEAGVGRAAVL